MTMPTSNRILLIEDNSIDSITFKRCMNELNPDLELLWVQNSEVAISKLDELKDKSLPALIVIDINMPYLNGIEVLQLLQENPRYNKIPAVIFSTSEDERDKKNALSAGAKEYFVKPIGFKNWLEEVGKMCAMVSNNGLLKRG